MKLDFNLRQKDLEKLIEKNDWYYVRKSGSHIIYSKEGRKDNIVLSSHNSGVVSPGVIRKIINQLNGREYIYAH